MRDSIKRKEKPVVVSCGTVLRISKKITEDSIVAVKWAIRIPKWKVHEERGKRKSDNNFRKTEWRFGGRKTVLGRGMNKYVNL